MKSWMESCKAAATRRLTVALLAVLAVWVGGDARVCEVGTGGGSSGSGGGAAR